MCMMLETQIRSLRPNRDICIAKLSSIASATVAKKPNAASL